MTTKTYHWKSVRQVLLDLKFREILTPDENVTLFHSSNLRLVMLRNRKGGISELQIQIICSDIGFPFTEFIRLLDKS